VHLVGLIVKKFVTMHGHINVKKDILISVVSDMYIDQHKRSGQRYKMVIMRQDTSSIQLCRIQA
jgi:hypothetical protein